MVCIRYYGECECVEHITCLWYVEGFCLKPSSNSCQYGKTQTDDGSDDNINGNGNNDDTDDIRICVILCYSVYNVWSVLGILAMRCIIKSHDYEYIDVVMMCIMLYYFDLIISVTKCM